MNGFNITLGSSATLSESLGNTIHGTSGHITTTRSLGKLINEDVVGLGFEMTSTGNLGNTTITLGVTQQINEGLDNLINGYFDISVCGGTPVDIVFNYENDEVNGSD